ncbi:hypothetical protein EW145_g7186 [Phellinidium pouzarii]|uniref:Uncharacterized protein n=1 Tax=Phellinidium pouzarii TaxID=167371 RepID=A0A4S4KNV2_9AGAM|nr:hypothetical protein EW145_g7186 [Phellinidium pouzarii]
MHGLTGNSCMHFLERRFWLKTLPAKSLKENGSRRTKDALPQDVTTSNCEQKSKAGLNETMNRWGEIDLEDPRSSFMETTNGVWLRSWKRGKEKILADLRRPGHVRHNSVPVIKVEEARSDP